MKFSLPPFLLGIYARAGVDLKFFVRKLVQACKKVFLAELLPVPALSVAKIQWFLLGARRTDVKILL